MGITTVETQTKTVVTTMEKPHKRVGIFGGTFNPPHYAHLVIAQHIQEELELDRIHFLPTAEPSHTNGKTTIPADYRVDMVELTLVVQMYCNTLIILLFPPAITASTLIILIQVVLQIFGIV